MSTFQKLTNLVPQKNLSTFQKKNLSTFQKLTNLDPQKICQLSKKKNLSTFQKLTNLGSQIRKIHLIESSKVEDYITEFNIDGNSIVLSN